MSMGIIGTIQGIAKTLIDRLSETRAGYLDLLNTLNSRWTAGRMTSLDSMTTDAANLISRVSSARAANLDNADTAVSALSGGYLSVQRGNVTLTSPNLSVTVSLSAAVNVARATLSFSYSVAGSLLGMSDVSVTGRIISTTQVTFARGGPDGTVSIYWEVAEWKTS